MNILTFDIEEWFHILDNDSTKTEKDWAKYEYRLDANMDRIFELLQKNNQKATFFCLGWIAREFPHVLKKIDDMGFEVATHSDMHQLAYEHNKKEFVNDLEKSIKSIEDVIAKKVITYRAPGFSIIESNKWVFEELVKQGIKIDCSVFPAKRAHGGFVSYNQAKPSLIEIEGITLKEFPINLFKIGPTKLIFSGGGYFRIFPYFLLKAMMKKSNYVMTYFHPRDFDFNQPIIKELNGMRKFKSYVGLKKSLLKLDRLIHDFDFIDLETADSIIDWNTVPIIKL